VEGLWLSVRQLLFEQAVDLAVEVCFRLIVMMMVGNKKDYLLLRDELNEEMFG
jgi:hypothetical protein